MPSRYEEYLTSAAWMARREEFFRRNKRACHVCGKKAVSLQVHHLTYDRLFHERDSDLVAVCGGCHTLIHDYRATEPGMSILEATKAVKALRIRSRYDRQQAKAKIRKQKKRAARPPIDLVARLGLPEGQTKVRYKQQSSGGTTDRTATS